MVNIRLPDGQEKQCPDGVTAAELLADLQSGAQEAAIAAKIDDEPVDLARAIQSDCSIKPITPDSEAGLAIIRHSAAHVMAAAVLRLWPAAKLAIGPPIGDGFYYDFDLEHRLAAEDLPRIEADVAKIVAENTPFRRAELPVDQARLEAEQRGDTYKAELIRDLQRAGAETVSTYACGGLTDLCRGPHAPSAGAVGAFRLLSVAGAYWRGDEKNPMLQRIYGTAFPTQAELDEHLRLLEEAKLRDHRRLAKELDLYSTHDLVGPGLILLHPKGGRIRTVMEDFWRKAHYEHGYELVYTPHIGRLQLWDKSGHTDFYREGMYSPMPVDDEQYQIKPMNCPFHIMIYKSRLRSYREFPMRWAELGTVYRYEKAGVLHGLLRTRGFTQDDAHVFCRPDQLDDEIQNTLDFTLYILRTFGFEEFDVALSTQPDKFVGEQDNWDKSTEALKRALETSKLDYIVQEGEGAFYGPKIDVNIRDPLKRVWQCTTIQVDFNIPERFDMTYVGRDNAQHRPAMIHRALMGSFERFFACLIEHYAGAFPLWLAPVQAVVIPITERHAERAGQVLAKLVEAGIRAELDARGEKVGFKIREHTMQKVPYMLVIGDREVESGQVAVRRYKIGDGGVMDIDALVKTMAGQVEKKS